MDDTIGVKSPCRLVTSEEVEHLHEHGWVKLKRFVDPEFVQTMLSMAQERMGEDADSNPLREGADLDGGIEQYEREGLDSLLSVCEIEDFFIWRIDAAGRAGGVNHDPAARKRRQEIEKRYLENGSFYVFAPELLRKHHNRLGGKIGLYVMAKHKLFQIDRTEDLALASAIMHGYGLDRSV